MAGASTPSVRPAADSSLADQIRALVAQHAGLAVPADSLAEDGNLYEAGLTSLSTVNLMLSLEEHFDVEFRDTMLGRKTFSSIRALCDAIEELLAAPPAGAR